MVVVYALLAIFGGVVVFDSIRAGPTALKEMAPSPQPISNPNAPVPQNAPITEAAYHVNSDVSYAPATGYTGEAQNCEVEVLYP